MYYGHADEDYGCIEANFNIGALMIRIGFWGPLYYKDSEVPPKTVQVMIYAPILNPKPYRSLMEPLKEPSRTPLKAPI